LPDWADVSALCRPLKDLAQRQASWLRMLFRAAALLVIGAHVLATTLAAFALKAHGPILPWLLALELLFLASGFGIHHLLHHSRATRIWGMARLAAEVGESVTALMGVAGRLSYLFKLPMPPSLNPLLETLNVAHMHTARKGPTVAWRDRLKEYVTARLTNPKTGQIAFYESSLARAKRHLLATRITFLAGAGGAFLAALAKLLLVLFASPEHEEPAGFFANLLGVLTVVLPVIAVAGLSLASSFDLEARAHTYGEMLDYLKSQQRHLEQAESEREFAALALETETRLLGAAATWYSRRAFTTVA
jgi:hypothetical protein